MTVGRTVARIGFAVLVLMAAAGIAAQAAKGWPIGSAAVLYVALALVFAAVGWLIVERQPGNVIGPILLAFGVGLGIYPLADAYLRQPDPAAGALVATVLQSLDLPSFVLIGLALALFPDGRPVGPRWRALPWLGLVAVLVGLAGVWLGDDPIILFPAHVSPLAIPGFPGYQLVEVAYALMLVLLALAVVSLILRWRRGTALERTQIKWIAAAAGAAAALELLNIATFDASDPNGAIAIVTSIGLALIPIAIGVAILRYRLYEIDRLISRTIAYAVVTGILAVVFVSIILALQAVLSTVTGGQTVAVAASTLAVFALFQPIRRRVQRLVDQRFDRARYDAERTASAFSTRLRHETDMATVTGDLARTARSALAPASLGVWIRGSRR